MPDLKIGLVGLDTSHVVAFAKCLNKPSEAEHVPGGRIVCAFPGGSKDWEISSGRVDKFTQHLRDDFDVKILDKPEAVAEAVDLLFITAVDGRTHLDYVRKTHRTFARRREMSCGQEGVLDIAADQFELGESDEVDVVVASRHPTGVELDGPAAEQQVLDTGAFERMDDVRECGQLS